MHKILPLLNATHFPSLRRGATTTLQVNLGYQCNQRCIHCHVNAGPHRTEMMSADTVRLIVPAMQAAGMTTLDLTGGAPEMHPQFRELVQQARAAHIHVVDRCNLTILLEPEQHLLAEFLAKLQVEIIASLPCYSTKNVDQQRGKGVFSKSIDALQRLNALGYGHDDSGLLLNLVYNPQGPTLPPEQGELEANYKRILNDEFSIRFNRLYVITNMPIQRFGSTLISKGQFYSYMQLLKDSFHPQHLDTVMCRSLVSVDWKGYLYDCDFNQQLNIPLRGNQRMHLIDLNNAVDIDQPIAVADHCFGCTAGQGSSCAGALAGAQL